MWDTALLPPPCSPVPEHRRLPQVQVHASVFVCACLQPHRMQARRHQLASVCSEGIPLVFAPHHQMGACLSRSGISHRMNKLTCILSRVRIHLLYSPRRYLPSSCIRSILTRVSAPKARCSLATCSCMPACASLHPGNTVHERQPRKGKCRVCVLVIGQVDRS